MRAVSFRDIFRVCILSLWSLVNAAWEKKGRLPHITCSPKGYEPCDISKLIENVSSYGSIFVSEVQEAGRNNCTGHRTELNGTTFSPTRFLTLAYICISGGSGPKEIGVIYYSGFAKASTVCYATYGMIWTVSATLILSPSVESLDSKDYYGKLAVKQGNCDSVAGELALLESSNKYNEIGYWKVRYKSKRVLRLYTANLVVCACDFRLPCAGVKDYKLYVTRSTIEGPKIASRMIVDCIVGARCIIDINAIYVNTRPLYILRDPYTNEDIALRSLPSGFEYVRNEGEILKGGMRFFLLHWIPFSSPPKDSPQRIEIGVVNIYDYNRGTFHVAPFGKQLMRLNIPWKKKTGEYFIFQRGKNVKKSDSSGGSNTNWKKIYDAKERDGVIELDLNFDAENEYSLRIMAPCSGAHCDAEPTIENTGIVATLVPQGVIKHVDEICTYNERCDVAVETVNMMNYNKPNEPVVLARSCRAGTIDMPVMSSKGKPTDITKDGSNITIFTWSWNPDGYIVFPGEIVKLCWCGFVNDKHEGCIDNDFSIEVGSVYIHPQTAEPTICYIGSVCSTFIRGSIEPNRNYFLATVCDSAGQYGQQVKLSYFNKEEFSHTYGTSVRLHLYLDSTFTEKGIVQLCSITTQRNRNELSINTLPDLFEIRKMRLKKKFYFMDVQEKKKLLFKRETPIHQFLIMATECGKGPIKEIYRYHDGGVEITSYFTHHWKKLCWCKVFGETRCSIGEDFKYQIGEIFISGFHPTNGIYCEFDDYCSVTLPYSSFYEVSKGSITFLPPSVALLLQKQCGTLDLDDYNLFMQYISSPVTIVQDFHDVFILKNDIHFRGTVNGLDVGVYSLCVVDTRTSLTINLSSLTIRHSYESDVVIGVYLGKPFNITVRGYDFDETTGFLSLNTRCERMSNVSLLRYEMETTPGLLYDDEDGKDIMIWLDVIVLINHYKTFLKGDERTGIRNNVLIMCLDTKNGPTFTGLRYRVHFPPMLNRVSHLQDAKMNMDMLPYLFVPFKRRLVILVVHVLREVPHRETCETNYWKDNLSRVVISQYTFDYGKKVTVNSSLHDAPNTYLCLCIGYSCRSLYDYRVSLLIPNEFGKPIFMINPFGDGVYKLFITGPRLSSYDMLTVVNKDVKCGANSASKFSDNLVGLSSVSKAFLANAVKGKESAGKTYTDVIRRGLISRTEDGITWVSHTFRMKKVSDGPYFLFRMCYCRYFDNYQCEKDEDFSDWRGAIVEHDVSDEDALVRITTFPSDMKEGVLPCMATHIVPASSSVVFKTKDKTDEIVKVISSFVSKHRNPYEGFMVEVCHHPLVKGPIRRREYKRVLLNVHRGYFRMQHLYIAPNTIQDVILHGIKIQETVINGIAVIPLGMTCESVNPVNAISYSYSKKMITPNMLLFEGLLVADEGNYKYCLNILDTGNLADRVRSSFQTEVRSHVRREFIDNFNFVEKLYKESEMTTDKDEFLDNMYSNDNSPEDSNKTNPKTKGDKTSLIQLGTGGRWEPGGIISVKMYQFWYIQDLMAFRNMSLDASPDANGRQYRSSQCRASGYNGLTLLCTLVNTNVFIVTDCNNVLWVVEIPQRNVRISSRTIPTRLILDVWGEFQGEEWKRCKESYEEKQILFLGTDHVVIIDYPSDIFKPKIVSAFRHGLRKPMDLASCGEWIIVSDDLTRTLMIYPVVKGITNSYGGLLLKRNSYYSALHVMSNGDKTYELFAVDPLANKLSHYRLAIASSVDIKLTQVYDGSPPLHGIDAGPLHRPNCIDGYLENSANGILRVIIIGENVSGRILIFKVSASGMGVYKEIHISDVLTDIAVKPSGRLLIMSAWHLYQGQMTNYILFRSIDSYIHMDFTYDTTENYSIRSPVELVPTFVGDKFEYFKERVTSSNGATPLGSLGLTLDEQTGVIRGSFVVTGKYTIGIIGGNMLKQIIRYFDIKASCPPSHQFHKDTKKCEQCPIGSFRNDEPNDICIPCNALRPNSTTQIAGARFLSDCLCIGGYYLEDDKCVPCKSGSLKYEIGNEACVGRCGVNMTTVLVKGPQGDIYQCVCQPRHFSLKLAVEIWKSLPPAILKLTGLTFSDKNSMVPNNIEAIRTSEDACIPCPTGYYCPGDKSMPISCGVGRTTSQEASDSVEQCLCDKGYGYDKVQGCIPCSGFGYKSIVGNNSCLNCTASVSADRVYSPIPVLPLMGPISIMSADEWENLLVLQHSSSSSTNATIRSYMNRAEVYATSERATDISQCSYCVAGKYYDSNSRSCVGCPDGSFCPGSDSQPVTCGPNAVTIMPSAKSPLDCFCSRGYGNVYDGIHPITRKRSCQYCPTGYFQPQEYTDGSCLPCPLNTTTKTVGSSTIMQCIPDPGYYLEIRKFPGDDVSKSEVMEEIDGNIEHFIANNRGELTVACSKTTKDSLSFAEVDVLIRPTLGECSQACHSNVYCKGYSFSDTIDHFDHNYNRYNAFEILVYNGLRFIKRNNGVCKLYLYKLSFAVLSDAESPQVLPEMIMEICRVTSAMNMSIQVKLCPLDHYCNNRVNYVKCPENSTTLGVGATSVSSCLCLPGYESPSAEPGVCVACQLGSYKQEIGNHGCRRCPDRFRTFSTGAKYITDCACGSGYYAHIPTDSSKVTLNAKIFKQMKDGRFLLSSDAEISQVKKGLKKDASYQKESESGLYNPYAIAISDDSDKENQIYSFIYLSKEAIILPHSAPRNLLDKLGPHQPITCERCTLHHYCPGGWVVGTAKQVIHNIPHRCPQGSSVPRESTNAVSIAHCLCLPGYRLRINASGGKTKQDDEKDTTANDNSETAVMASPSFLFEDHHLSTDTRGDATNNPDDYNSDYDNNEEKDNIGPVCVKCEAGMYKDAQENSSCSGRCMQYATTFGGAVSKKQCFCIYGRYMKFEGSLGSLQLTCARCMEGALCPGGLYPDVVEKLKKDGNFVDINLNDHVQPQARFGFFAAFKEQGVEKWSPSSQLMKPLNSVPTELLHFHPCPLEYNCVSSVKSRCYPGSGGYLCMSCHPGHSRSYFRSPCYICYNLLGEFGNYIYSRWELWLFAAFIMALLRRKLFFQFLVIKIWIDLYLSMVPYGVIPLNSPSSLRRFATYYNAVFGYQQKLFRYVRLHCVLDRLSIDVLTDTQLWYAERLLSVFQPLGDAFIMSILSAGIWAAYQAFITLLHWISRKNTNQLLRDSFPTNNMEAKGLEKYPEKGDNGTPQEAEEKPRRLGRGIRLSYWECLLALYYLSFQFICQELLQLLWCVDVRYNDEEPIKVLLHQPSHICSLSDPLFAYGGIAAATLLAVLLSLFTVILMMMVKQKRAHAIFTTGRQKHTLGWDAVLFLRRFFVAMNTIFQPSPASTGPAEKLRITFSLLTTSVLLILHMSVLPYQIRDDNVYNRLKLLSLILNTFTAFTILGSFSYDFSYYNMIPVAAFLAFILLLLWNVLIECGYISVLRPKLRKRPRLCRHYWSFCRHLLVLSCKAQITFNYAKDEMVIERPFSENRGANENPNNGNKRAVISLNGRRALCTSIEQSVCRYVMEQRCFCVPLSWKEFVIRYAFGYKWANLSLHRGTITNSEIQVQELFATHIFDSGPINTWQLSMAILNIKMSTILDHYKDFEHKKLDKLWKLKCQYSTLCFNATQSLSNKVDNVPEMIDLVHELHRLTKRAEYLESQFNMHLRNAEDGERVTRQVQELGSGMDAMIYGPITNEEILQQIAEHERLRMRQN